MPRARTMLRASAELVAHPSRLRQWRTHLGDAWRTPGAGSRRSGPPRHLPGPPPRPTRALVIGDSALGERLRPEWEQLDTSGGPVLDGVDLVVLLWPSTSDQAPDLPDAATPGRVVVWDEADPGSPACPAADRADLVVVGTAARAGDYPGVRVLVQPAAVQPRRHNPAVATGARVPRGRLAGPGADPVLDPVDSLLGEPTRPDRTYAVVCARGGAADPHRVRELLAEGTVVLTSDEQLHAAVPVVGLVGSTEIARQELAALGAHPELRRRRAQLGAREVLASGTTTVAVDAVLEQLGVATPRRGRPVSAIVPTMRPDQIPHVLEFVARQSHEQVQLVLVTHGFDADAGTAAAARDLGVDLRLVGAAADLTLGALMNLGVDAADGEFVAKMDDDNHYGAHYLADLLTTFDFSGAQVAGKWAHFTYLQSSGATFLRFPHAENTLTRLVQGGTLVLPRAVASELRFEDLPRRVDTTFLEKVSAAGGTVYSADRYNFVSVRGASVEGHTWKITDSELLAKPSAELFFGEPWTHVDI